MDQPFILKLSQEVVDEVVDHLSHSKQALDACSKANKIFRHRCQKHLFSMIHLASDRGSWSERVVYSPRKERIKHLLDILQQSPHIARCVHGLHLDIASCDNDWVAEDPNFTRIMEIIKQSGSSIRELKLRGFEFPEKFADARSLEQKFLLPFISASLTTLHLSNVVDIPMSLIANSPNMKTLSLNYSAFEYYGEHIDKDLIQALPKIQTLQLHPPDAVIGSLFGNDIFDDMLLDGLTDTIHAILAYSGRVPTIGNITSLKTFKSFNDSTYMMLTQAVIKTARHSLEELYLCEEYEDEFHQLANSINLSGASQLRILSTDIIAPTSGTVDALEDLCSVLGTIPKENFVEKIFIQVFIGQYHRQSVPAWAHKLRWELLDSQIVRIADGKALHFSLHILFLAPNCDDSESDSDNGDHGESESSSSVRPDVSGKGCERNLNDICKSTFSALLLQRMKKVMGSSTITTVPTYSIHTSYPHYDPAKVVKLNIL